MKTLFTVLSLFVLFHTAFGQDFRNISWGMTIAEVQEIEGYELKASGSGGKGAALYHYSVPGAAPGGGDASIRYFDYDGQVLQAGIMLGFLANATQHIETYEAQKKQYTLNYGAPQREEIVWLDETYKDRPEKWTSALILGHLVYQTDWQSGTSLIRMTLRAWDYTMYLSVYYRSLEHQALIEQYDNITYDYPGEDEFNGFKRYSQAEVDAASESDGWDVDDVKFKDHGSFDHNDLWGSYPLAEHSLDELVSELDIVKRAEAECLQQAGADCDDLKEVRTDLEDELAKRR